MDIREPDGPPWTPQFQSDAEYEYFPQQVSQIPFDLRNNGSALKQVFLERQRSLNVSLPPPLPPKRPPSPSVLANFTPFSKEVPLPIFCKPMDPQSIANRSAEARIVGQYLESTCYGVFSGSCAFEIAPRLHLPPGLEWPPCQLRSFVEILLYRTQLLPTVTNTALYLISRIRDPSLRGKLQGTSGAPSIHIVFLIAMTLASKLIQDDPYSNKSWIQASGIQIKVVEFNALERRMCELLDYKLTIHSRYLQNIEMELGTYKKQSGPPTSRVGVHCLFNPSVSEQHHLCPIVSDSRSMAPYAAGFQSTHNQANRNAQHPASAPLSKVHDTAAAARRHRARSRHPSPAGPMSLAYAPTFAVDSHSQPDPRNLLAPAHASTASNQSRSGYWAAVRSHTAPPFAAPPAVHPQPRTQPSVNSSLPYHSATLGMRTINRRCIYGTPSLGPPAARPTAIVEASSRQAYVDPAPPPSDASATGSARFHGLAPRSGDQLQYLNDRQGRPLTPFINMTIYDPRLYYREQYTLGKFNTSWRYKKEVFQFCGVVFIAHLEGSAEVEEAEHGNKRKSLI
ncbi:hypothetical protein IEO21_03290 [Rhodonia placenta]|uniref:Cyclin N-terminal domain-containing protein n=1 Tax=Rhodonia placenta TaxID=104341 RepID=A0A8H7U4A4_9APHY|nr:hypothetical protein IEO21_03290 [Postia placenta]